MRATGAPADRGPRRAERAGVVRLSRARPGFYAARRSGARLSRAERPIPLVWPALRSRPGPNPASRGRSGRAPLRAATARSRRRGSHRRAPDARRSAPTPAGRLRRPAASPSPCLLDLSGERALGKLYVDLVACCEKGGGADDLVLRADDRIAAFECCARRERTQSATGLFEPGPPALEEERRAAPEPVVRMIEASEVAVEHAYRGRFEGGATRLEALQELPKIGNDDARRRGRRGGANVRDQVAQRRVLLVPDGRDDRDCAVGNRPHEALVAEREQVLEAAAAARDHDHFDARRGAQATDGVDDRRRGAGSLHVSLGHEDSRRRKARSDSGQDVAFRRGVVSGHQADSLRHERQGTLALGGEQALASELLLQPLERGEVRTEPEPLDRERAEAEVAALLEQLGTAVDVDALAVR